MRLGFPALPTDLVLRSRDNQCFRESVSLIDMWIGFSETMTMIRNKASFV